MIGRRRLQRRLEAAECGEFLVIDARIFRCDFADRRAGFFRSLDDLVVDIGEIARVNDCIFAEAPAQQAKEEIERNRRTEIADMGVIVDRRSADIHRHPRGIGRNEPAFFASKTVVKMEHRLLLNARQQGRKSLPSPSLLRRPQRCVWRDRGVFDQIASVAQPP